MSEGKGNLSGTNKISLEVIRIGKLLPWINRR